MASVNTQQIAPGTRLEIRDEEWLVRTIDRTSNGDIVYAVLERLSFVEAKLVLRPNTLHQRRLF